MGQFFFTSGVAGNELSFLDVGDSKFPSSSSSAMDSPCFSGLVAAFSGGDTVEGGDMADDDVSGVTSDVAHSPLSSLSINN